MEEKIDFSWPAKLNLGILADVMSEKDLLKLIADHMNKPLEKRRITLPSIRTSKKVFCHNLWRRILFGEMTWEQYKKSKKNQMFKTGIRKDKIIELFEQRQREILDEIKQEKS